MITKQQIDITIVAAILYIAVVILLILAGCVETTVQEPSLLNIGSVNIPATSQPMSQPTADPIPARIDSAWLELGSAAGIIIIGAIILWLRKRKK